MNAFLAMIGVPTAAQCLQVLGPIAAIVAAIWMIGNADHFVRRLFPRPDWEQQLGWLDLRAERKASGLLRWCSYGVHLIFAILLLGMVWGATGLTRLSHLDDPAAVRVLANRAPVLLFSFTLCLAYIVAELLPRLRREFEEEELERYRAENPDAERERRKGRKSPSRAISGSLIPPKPRGSRR